MRKALLVTALTLFGILGTAAAASAATTPTGTNTAGSPLPVAASTPPPSARPIKPILRPYCKSHHFSKNGKKCLPSAKPIKPILKPARVHRVVASAPAELAFTGVTPGTPIYAAAGAGMLLLGVGLTVAGRKVRA